MSSRLRRACLVLGTIAALWLPVALVTGGVAFDVAGVRVSARGVRNPMLLVVLAATAAWALAPAGRRFRVLQAEAGVLLGGIESAAAAARFGRVAPPAIVVAAAAAAVAIGIGYGAFVGGGSDSYGYVSQAALWATSIEPVEEPLMRILAHATYQRELFVPLGWRATAGHALVPTYAPGLPIVMSVFERIGGAGAMFYAVPALAALAVVATYVFGRAVAGAVAGAAAAVLLTTSPIFLAFLTAAPMSDIPATAWWTLMLALLTYDRRSADLGAGVAAGLAILTRPNLLPLALAPAALVIRPWMKRRRLDRATLSGALLFAAGVAAGCLAVAAINTYWYGSPAQTGYGPLTDYFDWRHWRANASHWFHWLTATQTPLAWLAAAGPFILRRGTFGGARRAGLLATAGAFAVLLVAAYLFYVPFDEWLFLRFLLPGFPLLMVLLAAALYAASRMIPRFAPGHAVLALCVGLLAWHGVTEARERLVFDRRADYRYAAAGRYVARQLPANAVLLAVQHSGSARLYSGRPTLRWDWLRPHELDMLIDDLRSEGYAPYLLLENWEIPAFRTRFPHARAMAAVAAPPLARTADGMVRVYDVVTQHAAHVPSTIAAVDE